MRPRKRLHNYCAHCSVDYGMLDPDGLAERAVAAMNALGDAMREERRADH